MKPSAHRAVELAARDSYGRLVAWLTSRCRDLQLAEDAVADALEAALRSWPEKGVPQNPEAWLLTTARRRVIDRARKSETRRAGMERLRLEAQEAAEFPFRSGLPDRRLDLMLLCAHPDIAPEMRTPLMLQTVLGLNAKRIASAMLVKPATMGQRLSRVKRRIKADAIRFEPPAEEALPARIGYLLDAIYAAYGTGWEASSTGLAEEAIWLARLIVGLAPQVAEAKGLLALMLYCESRREARRGPDGEFVPLEEQDTTRWDHEQILEAEKALWLAAKLHQQGPYQCEAAIQSLHAHRARSGRTDWQGVHLVYGVLMAHFPSLGGAIGHAASYGRIGQPLEGLAHLDALPADAVARHQPYWAVRAHLLALANRSTDAAEAYSKAIGLTTDPALRRWLKQRREGLGGEG